MTNAKPATDKVEIVLLTSTIGAKRNDKKTVDKAIADRLVKAGHARKA